MRFNTLSEFAPVHIGGVVSGARGVCSEVAQLNETIDRAYAAKDETVVFNLE